MLNYALDITYAMPNTPIQRKEKDKEMRIRDFYFIFPSYTNLHIFIKKSWLLNKPSKFEGLLWTKKR